MRQLQSLSNEFDLAYATKPEFDIEAARLLCHLTVNLFFGAPHIGNCLRMRLLMKNHITNQVKKNCKDRFISRRSAGANQHLAFPAFSLLMVIVGGTYNFPDHISIASIGSEA